MEEEGFHLNIVCIIFRYMHTSEWIIPYINGAACNNCVVRLFHNIITDQVNAVVTLITVLYV